MTDVPNSGMIIPNMGTKRTARRSGLADALFTPVQQRVLGLLFGQPDRRFQSAEIIRLAKGGVGAVHRQLSRLAASDLVIVTRPGTRRLPGPTRLASSRPGLITKTVGVVSRCDGRSPDGWGHTRGLRLWLGRENRGQERHRPMVVSDSLRHADLFEALQKAEVGLGRTINPTLMTAAQWRAKRARADSFAARVAAGPRVFVIGSEDDLG
jgi:hypothetical protein